MLDINERIIDYSKKKLVDKFLNSDIEKYILGKNDNSQRLSELVDVSGYIDDFTSETKYLNKFIFKSSQIENKEAIVVSCSLAIYPSSAINSLEKAGFKNILTVMDVNLYSNSNLEIMFMSNARMDLENNLSKYKKIYTLMNENKSKSIFKNIISFRKNFDLKYMKEYKVDEIGQYFEDFLNLQESEVFIAAGGFDGQTSIEFINHCPKYKSVYIFEPDSDNLELAKNNLSDKKNINFISKGLSNQQDTLRFDTGSRSASSISENASIEIEVDTLDNLVQEKVTFIKIDIEGAEGLAIEGMKNHILNDHPKMAISVYHKVDDFWKIPEQIFAIRNDYDIYMRHYTEGTDATVMFFMPKI